MRFVSFIFLVFYNINLLAIDFTKEEQEYIKTHPVVKVHNELNWAPFNFNENGNPQGLSIDYMNLVAQKVGLKVEYVSGPSWNEFVEMMKNKQLDIMLNIVKNEEREKFLLFTSYYQEAPHGIIVRVDSDKKITNLNELLQHKIATEEGFFNHNYLTKNHPNANLALKKDTLGALQAVSYGEADATFGILPIENYIMQKNSLNNLKIIGISDDKLFAPKQLCMAVSIDNKILQGILQKGLSAVTLDEKNEINKRWVNINLESGVDYVLLAKIFGVFALVMAVTIFWVIRLKRVQNKLESAHLLLKTMLDALPNPVFYKDENARFVGFNKAYEDTFNVKSEDLIGKTVLELDFLPMEDRLRYQAEDVEAIKLSSAVIKEQQMTLGNGQMHYTIYSVNGFKNGKGEPAGLVGVFVDITAQKEAEAKLQETMKEVEELHQNFRASVEYASLIQSSIVSLPSMLKPYFSEVFSVWQPKDTVGGDIVLFEEVRANEACLLFVIDCTGHGVPGAFVTMLVKAIERNIMAKITHNPDDEISPAKLLSVFNGSVKHILKQGDKNAMSNAGFDGTIIYYDKKTKIVRFASAQNPSLFIKDGVVTEYKGDKHSVGYRTSDANFCFTDYEIAVEPGDRFFFATDGLYDQNGGAKDLPLGRKRISKIFTEYKDEPLNEIKELILHELGKHQGKNQRNDDMAFVGLTI